jgi:uncharacterized protein (TIGR03435 family)
MKTALVLATSLLLAQTAPPRQFDVASVKVNTTKGKTTRRDEPLGMTYLNITLGEFIRLAYGVRSYQIEGPDWITDNGSSARFDIVAKASTPMTEQELRAALVPLLAERFHLTLHRETRTLPVYLLVVDKDGPKLKEGDGGESNVMPDPASGGVRYANYPIAALAATLSVMPSTGRPVLDRTGLTGKYTFTANLFDIPAGLSIADEKRAIARSETPAFTALREQLGLRLEPDRAPIDLLVVDHADKTPTSD